MIEVKALSKKYSSQLAVDNLSFTVEDGQVYGFLGPNGAGKSTTMNIITGCLAATSGTVIIDGFDIFENPIEAKSCIGYLPEIPPLYPDMTVYEYLRFVGKAKGLRKKELLKSIDDVIEKTDVFDMKGRLIKNLSKGYRQRVGIAQAILGNPKVIILDEPTVGLDPKQIIEIRELIHELSKDKTVILSSHILSEVSAICDKILIISKGKLVALDTPENLTQSYMGSKTVELSLRAADSEKAAEILSVLEGVQRVDVSDGNDEGLCLISVECQQSADLREKIAVTLMDASCPVLSMNVTQASLEDIFLEATEKNTILAETPGEKTESEGDEE